MLRITAILAALLLGQAARAAEKQAPNDIPLYPGAVGKNFQGTLRANTIPIDAQIFETSDNLEKVLEFYRKELAPHGQYLVEHHFNADMAYIGFWDLKTERMKLATLIRISPGTTWIVISGMDPRGLVQEVDLPPDVPTALGARGVTTTSSREGGAESQSITYQVEGQPAEKVREEIIRDAEKKGWRRQRDPYFAERGPLMFEKADRHCLVQIISRKEGNLPLVTVSVVLMEEKGVDAKQAQEE